MVVTVSVVVDLKDGATTTTTTKSVMKFSTIQHGRIKDRSYFTESPSTKVFTEKNDCMKLVDISKSDVAIIHEPITQATAVIYSILVNC